MLPFEHGPMLHACFALQAPVHVCPPNDAAGLVHVLVFTWAPTPQLTLHAPQQVHVDQFPSKRCHYR